MWDLPCSSRPEGAAMDGCLIPDSGDSLGLCDEQSFFSFLKDLMESICLFIPRYKDSYQKHLSRSKGVLFAHISINHGGWGREGN